MLEARVRGQVPGTVTGRRGCRFLRVEGSEVAPALDPAVVEFIHGGLLWGSPRVTMTCGRSSHAGGGRRCRRTAARALSASHTLSATRACSMSAADDRADADA